MENLPSELFAKVVLFLPIEDVDCLIRSHPNIIVKFKDPEVEAAIQHECTPVHPLLTNVVWHTPASTLLIRDPLKIYMRCAFRIEHGIPIPSNNLEYVLIKDIVHMIESRTRDIGVVERPTRFVIITSMHCWIF